MPSKSQNLSIIDKGLIVDGDIRSTGRLVIKGTVRGSIEGETIIVAEEGKVFSEIKANSLTIGGNFEGDIKNCT